MFTVTAGTTAYAYELPNTTEGRVTVRVRDNNRASNTVDSIRVDELLITTEIDGTATNPPVAPSSLTATATSHSTVALTWSDNALDESGYLVERSLDESSWSSIASLTANSVSYNDSGLSASTLYYYRVSAFNSAGSSSTVETSVMTDEEPVVPGETIDQRAIADVVVSGTITGDYRDTWYEDGVVESIREQVYSSWGSEYAYLEHKWTFDVAAGDRITLSAVTTTDAANDSFTFAYSVNGGSYINMFTVVSGASAYSYVLPNTTEGTVTVRVIDTNRNGDSADAIHMDELLIKTEID